MDSSATLPKDADVLLLLFCELMRSRKLASTLPLCSTPLPSLTHTDLIKIARGFEYLSKTTSADGDSVKATFDRYPSMRELAKRNPFLEEALIVTSVRLNNASNKASTGFRLTLGVLLSFFDTLSDINMIFLYSAAGNHNFAKAILISILCNMGIQLFLVWLQYRKQSWSKLFREALTVLTLTKNGVDSYRVSRGAEPFVGSYTDPKSEMMMTKCAELFAEAIPGTCIQTFALLGGCPLSFPAIFGLVTSVVTASFISTLVSYECDLDRNSRAHSPTFYGYFPDNAQARMSASISMFLFSACQLTARAFSLCLAGSYSCKVLLTYIVGDQCVYLLYKLLRGDFTYVIDSSHPATSFFLSLCCRLVVKNVADFTGNTHMRHPYEVGGSYWALTILSTPFFSLYFGSCYLKFVESEEGKAMGLEMVLSPKHVYGMIGGLVAFQALVFFWFLRSIKPEYIYTFYDAKSGNQQAEDHFMLNMKDEHKVQIFLKSQQKWLNIKEEVVEWTTKRIPKWNESQPDWWNPRLKSVIPDWGVSDPETLKTIRSDLVEAIRRGGPRVWESSETDDDLEASVHQSSGNSDDGESAMMRRRRIARQARRDLQQVGRYL
ncbi:hypothetical protein TrLO_g5524 [Triparma laevis f. longispina]|uniref:Uncharacterized protein n=1 Tax=Triparma laevis f. longispina TaxID=1714387 RepID=A0A9W6ZXF9_9STRA|nr:hypothetical protein TrLO_g5524 [Triparma laevis f. longispina]